MKHRNRDIRILNNRRPGSSSLTAKSARYINNSKRGLRASGLSLLPLALRPGLLLFLMLGFCFVLQNSYSKSVSATSLTLTIPNSISLDINPNSNNGFKKSDTNTLSVKTDVSYGYTLSIKSKDSANNNLVNGSAKLSSIGSAMNESDFSSSAGNNTWGYLPSKLKGSDNSNFQPGPTSEPTVLDTTDSASEGTNYDFTLAAKIDNTIPTGNYTNTFVLTAVSNEPPVVIMQNWNGCDELGDGDTIELQDTRDNKMYTVAKLKDGKCWMTKNLEISDYNLTSADSDVASDFKLPVSSTSGFKDNNTANVYVDSVNGGYYTWYAATAGEGNSGKSSGDTSHSICPKGWKLPDILDYEYLTLSYDDSKSLMSSPANFIKANLYRNGALTKSENASNGNKEDVGFFWSSTIDSSSSTAETYQLRVADDGINTTMSYVGSSGGTTVELFNVINQINRSDGGSIRCVSRSSDIGTLQDVSEWGNKVDQGQTVNAIDSRNNKRYTVARLNDGKLWMTQNLEISNITLNSTDSDVSSNFTLPASNSDGFSTSYASSVKVYIQEGAHGGYYNYKAATAGTSPSSGDATQSICPKGWKLPSKTEFENLMSKQGEQNITKTPAYFLGGGCASCREVVSGQGYYWLSTAYDYQYAYEFQTLGDYGLSGPEVSYNFKFRGYNVRCVAREPEPKSYSITYQPGLDECNQDIEIGSSRLSDMPSPNPQTGSTTENSIKLSSNTINITKGGFSYYLTFKAWCTSKPTNSTTCPGQTYMPGASYPLSDGVNNITLWAIWDENRSSEPTSTICAGGGVDKN